MHVKTFKFFSFLSSALIITFLLTDTNWIYGILCYRISNKSDWAFTPVRANGVIANKIGSTSIWGLALINI